MNLGCINVFPEIKGGDVYKSETVSIGYWLGKPFWGRGLMTEAVATLCSRCFDSGRKARQEQKTGRKAYARAAMRERAASSRTARSGELRTADSTSSRCRRTNAESAVTRTSAVRRNPLKSAISPNAWPGP